METVLVVGSTGNIGVAAVTASLRTKRNVIAIVRNQTSAEKLFKHVGTREGITTIEADVTSEHGVQSVVDQVKAGKLPPFHHVFATVGVWHNTPLKDLDPASFREVMNVTAEGNFFAYRATIPYLLEQNYAKSTWTLMTGAAGEVGAAGVTAVSQGALFAMANAASRENQDTNIRFNELFLALRVDYDSVAKEQGVMSSTAFGRTYEHLLERKDIGACRVSVLAEEDVDELKFEKKLRQ